MHPQRLFLLYVASNSGKRYWDCKLPCIEAQIELSSTFVYDQEMSTSSSSGRNSHLSQGDERQWCPCLRTDLYKHVLQSKTWQSRKKLPIHWTKECQKFQSKFIHGQYFCDNIFFALWCNSVDRYGHHCRSFPLGEVRILRTTATLAHFVIINKGAGSSMWALIRGSVQSQYLFPELEATNSSKSRWKCIAIHQNVCSRSLSQNCQGIF